MSMGRDEMASKENAAYERLRKMKWILTKDQARLIKGQIRAGQIEGAMKGMDTILKRRVSHKP